MDVLPNALVNRAVGVAVFEDGAVVACDAAAVKRFWTSDAAEWRAPAKIAAFASFEATVAVGLTDGEVWLLDAATLAPLRSVAASEVGVASVALSSAMCVVGDAEGLSWRLICNVFLCARLGATRRSGNPFCWPRFARESSRRPHYQLKHRTGGLISLCSGFFNGHNDDIYSGPRTQVLGGS